MPSFGASFGANIEPAEPQAAPFKQPIAESKFKLSHSSCRKLADTDRHKETSSVAATCRGRQSTGASAANSQAKIRCRADTTLAMQDLSDDNGQARMSRQQGDQAAPNHSCDCGNTLDVERLLALCCSCLSIVIPRRSCRCNKSSLDEWGEKEEARDPHAGKEEEQKKHGRQHRVQGKARPG